MPASSSIVLRLGGRRRRSRRRLTNTLAATDKLVATVFGGTRHRWLGATAVERVDKLVQTGRPSIRHPASGDRPHCRVRSMHRPLRALPKVFVPPRLWRALQLVLCPRSRVDNEEIANARLQRALRTRPHQHAVPIRQAMDVALEDHRAPDFPQFTLPLLRRFEEDLPDQDRPSLSFSGFWHRWLGIRHRQHTVAGRQGAGFGVRPVLSAVGRSLPALRPRGRCHRRRMGQGRAARPVPCSTWKPTRSTRSKPCWSPTTRPRPVSRPMSPACASILDDLNHPALLFVDGVSSIASIDFRMDEWGVDVAVAGSQKGFMLPTGLAIVCVSRKGIEGRRERQSCRAAFSIIAT